MIRSGSTLQLYVASKLLAAAGWRVRNLGFVSAGKTLELPLEEPKTVTICKLHHWDEKLAELVRERSAVALYSFRDLRDVAVSAQRQFAVNFDQLWDEKWLHDAVAAGDKWLALPGVHSAKYEIFSEKLATEVLKLASFLNLELAPETLSRIAEECSLENMRAAARANADTMRATGRPDENGGNAARPWMPHEGRIGDWKTELTPEQQTVLLGTFSQWLTVRGYLSRAEDPAVERNELPGETFVPHIGWLKHEPSDEVAHLLREGHYEADLQAFLWLYLRPGDRFADIGAHFGLYASLAAQLVGPEGAVLAFEPHPQTSQDLRANTIALPQVQCMEMALTRQAGHCFLQLSPSSLASHSSLSNHPVGGVEVRTAKFESVIADAGWDRVALAKIDTEGSEFEVLEGFGELLGSSRAPVLSLEFSEANLLSVGRTSRQLGEFVQRRGYTLCRLDFTQQQLVPVNDDIWPVWYENFFAVLDLATVNRILAEAPDAQRRIARDVCARAQSCSRLGELAQLATYRERAQLSSFHLQWAQKTEQLLAEERQKSEDYRRWAERTEELLAHDRSQHRVSVARENELAAEIGKCNDWAQQAEQLLAEERRKSEDLQRWAEQAERFLSEERKLSNSRQAWAEQTEKSLAETRELAAGNQGWAERTERLLAEERQLTSELRARLKELESKLATDNR